MSADCKEAVLSIEDLWVSYSGPKGSADALRGVSLQIQKGETYGIVGESGCGKSTLAFAIMGYLAANGRVRRGHIHFYGEDLVALSERQLRTLRGRRMAMVYQESSVSLNPSITVGEQIAEVYRTHLHAGRDEARQLACQMLEKVHLPDPAAAAQRYPHQLSGGMQQRVVIAMALSTNPDLLVMDEPTTALDVTTEAVILDLINELKTQFDSTIVYISHNLGVVARVCDRAAVMYAGEVVEKAAIGDLFARPGHPYTRGLLRCVPVLGTSKDSAKLEPIRGGVAPLAQLPPGCAFSPRCDFGQEHCPTERPEWITIGEGHVIRCFGAEQIRPEGLHRSAERAAPPPSGPDQSPVVLAVDAVSKHYDAEGGLFGGTRPGGAKIKAVDGVSFAVRQGCTLGIVGESGCGKSTIGRCIVGLTDPTAGHVVFEGADVTRHVTKRDRAILRGIQMVFQNPHATLNPKQTVGFAIGRALRMLQGSDRAQDAERIVEQLQAVKLDESFKDRYPDQLSGGEKQRVAIARVFAGQPRVIVCDEPLSALDVSVQASIVNLLMELQSTRRTSYVFISHDLSAVRYLADYIGVIYLGRLCEIGPAEEVFRPPYHPYTEALLSAVPIPDPTATQKRIRLEGSVPSALNPPSGCRFHTRCHRKIGAICGTEDPPCHENSNGLRIFCHIPLSELAKLPPVTSRS